MKNQITIQKLPLDEKTFNNNLKEMERTIHNLTNDISYCSAPLKLLETYETLVEKCTFFQSELDDILK